MIRMKHLFVVGKEQMLVFPDHCPSCKASLRGRDAISTYEWCLQSYEGMSLVRAPKGKDAYLPDYEDYFLGSAEAGEGTSTLLCAKCKTIIEPTNGDFSVPEGFREM